jgi:hypothetical protein
MKKQVVCLLLPLAALHAAEKGLPKGEGSNKTVRVEASAYLDKASIKQIVGLEMPEGVVVVEVKLTPLGSEKLSVNREDFLFRSDRDGQRATPYAPSQIAGSSVIRISSRAMNGGVMAEDRGPRWGGLGGLGFPGGGGAVGGGGASATEAVATVDENNGKRKEDPLLEVLNKKVLEEKETSEPISGQLYFLMEGKQKVKDIELLYKTAAGRVAVRFKDK